MKKHYSSSLYSQKSTTSARSGRSFLSLSTSIWPSSKKKENSSEKKSVWENLRRLVVLKSTAMRRDNDSIATRSINTTTSTSSSSSSASKLKHLLFFSLDQTIEVQSHKVKSSDTASTPPPNYYTTLNEINLPVDQYPIEKLRIYRNNGPTGILINRGEDSTKAIEERERRRHKRREHILKLQQHNHGFRRHLYPSSDSIIDPAIDYQHHVIFDENIPPEPSSSDTLVTNESAEGDHQNPEAKPRVGFYEGEKNSKNEGDRWEFNPRITFAEPSPVPRFRNAAPPPPPSPLYMNIIVDQAEFDDHDRISRKNDFLNVIKSPTIENNVPTIFSRKEMMSENNLNYFDADEDRRMTLLMESLCPRPIQKPHLYFDSPYQRGQTIRFSLQNTIPEDHIIIFKFLTSNSSKEKDNSVNTINSVNQPERYFVRPSAGRMVSTDQTDIMLFLNQVPTLRPGEHLKDKILVRWAVIQRNTRIEKWVNSLNEFTRKKWIDMLAEQWPDQVTIQMTKIKVHFV